MIEKLRLMFQDYQAARLREKLKSAIKKNDPRSLKNLLNESVTTKINLNEDFGLDLDDKKSILTWLFRDKMDFQKYETHEEKLKKIKMDEIKVEMIHAILDIRNEGHLVIDVLHNEEKIGLSDFSRILRLDIPSEAKAVLLKKILDSGDVQVDKKSIMKLLDRFIGFDQRDPVCLDLLLNFFEKTPDFQINRLFPTWDYAETLLDKTIRCLKNARKDSEEKRERIEGIVDVIKRHGGLLCCEMNEEQKKYYAPFPVRQEKEEARQEKIIEQYRNNPQNTGKFDQSVSVSLNKLGLRYSEHLSLKPQGVLESKAAYLDRLKPFFEPIEDYLNSLPEVHPHKTKAIECFNRIKERDYIISGTRFTLIHALALVWQGVIDKEAIPEVVKNTLKSKDDIEKYIENRKTSLVEKLFEAQILAYDNDPERPACSHGTGNKIVEILNTGHPDVMLIPDGLAKGYASEGAIPFVRNLLIKKTLTEQKEILFHWHESGEEGIAGQFRREVADQYKEYLTRVYGDLLEEKDRNNILSCFNEEDLPRPVVHEKLNALISKIEAFLQKKKSWFPKESTSHFEMEIINNYLSKGGSFESIDQLLQPLEEAYEKLQKLDALINKIKGMSAKEEDIRRQESLSILKEQVNHALLEERTFLGKYQAINAFYREFQKREVGNYLNETQAKEAKKSKFHKFWAGFFERKKYTCGTKKMDVAAKIMQNLNDENEYDTGLDENEKQITIQTGQFRSALN